MCRRKQWMTAVLLATLTAVLTACGSAKSSADTASVATYDTEAAMVEDTDYFSDGTYEEVTYDEGESGTEVTEEVAATERKLIKNVSLDVETENYDSLIQTVESQVQQLGGYIESRYSNNRQYGNPDYYADNRYTSMTIRIPKEKLDTFLQTMGEESNIVSQSESVTDVTLQYVDLESHKKALVTEQDRLLELLEQAETVEDIMTIESRLSDVRYQIDSMESQLRTYDNQVDYSTVNLSIDEVEQYTPSPDISAGEKMKQGFTDSLKAVGMIEYRHHSPNKLSGGQKQRVAIAGVMAMRPKCIVLDEPTAMLDPNGRKEVLRSVMELRKREHITVILITHYMEEVVDADHVFVMDHGHVVMQGTPREIFSIGGSGTTSENTSNSV